MLSWLDILCHMTCLVRLFLNCRLWFWDRNTAVGGFVLILLVFVGHHTSCRTFQSPFCFLLMSCTKVSVGFFLAREIIGYSLTYGLEYKLVHFVLIGISFPGAGGCDSRLLYKVAHATCRTSIVLIIALAFVYFCSSVF